MAGDSPRRITRRGHARVARAVEAAERTTGLDFSVYLGPATAEDPRQDARELFVQAGLPSRPAVLVHVVPDRRRVDVLTSDEARARLSDEACAGAVDAMTARFARGDLDGGIVAGVEALAAAAGPGTRAPGATDLPDVIDGGT